MLVASTLLAACGEAPASKAPATPRPTPVVTPDPHLDDPATADQVFLGLVKAGLRMTANNADAGGAGDDLVKRINATYLGWPLSVSEYRTAKALAEATDWSKADDLGQGDPPVDHRRPEHPRRVGSDHRADAPDARRAAGRGPARPGDRPRGPAVATPVPGGRRDPGCRRRGHRRERSRRPRPLPEAVP